jgi:hypothetical protein
MGEIKIDQKFGVFTVINSSFKNEGTKKPRIRNGWRCICDCGNIVFKTTRELKKGAHLHCDNCPTSPLKGERLYGVYVGIMSRCYTKSSTSFSRYGGRGIFVCDLWRNNPASFISWGNANGWSEGLQIDRIDNNGGYSPNNCRFVSRMVNSRNKEKLKRNTTGFTGVSRRYGKFFARITIKRKTVYLGYFKTPELAASRRDRYITDNNLEGFNLSSTGPTL